MGLLLSMLPFWVTILYSIIVLFFFPTISVVAGLVLLGILRNSIEKEGLTISTRALGVLVFYFLPELSHYLTKESTVLNIETITIYDAIDNFFFLYPQSVLALTKAGY